MAAATIFNVEGSLNAWMRAGLAAQALPSFITSYRYTSVWSDLKTTTYPTFSVIHLPGYRDKMYQGNRAEPGVSAALARGIMEVSAWVERVGSNGGNDKWLPQVMYMVDMIDAVVTGTMAVVIKDYKTSLTSPSDTAYKVDIGDFTLVQTGEDENPALERRRMLINYSWNVRA